MKRLAVIFAVAVIAPSLVLAWLALRSLNDQQFVLERQQSLLCQGIADTLARNVTGVIEERQREFGAQVETLLATNNADAVATQFDERLRAAWPAAAVGFVVSLKGEVLCPSVNSSAAALQFRKENDLFLCNRESAEVYWGGWKANPQNTYANSSTILGNSLLGNSSLSFNSSLNNSGLALGNRGQSSPAQTQIPTANVRASNVTLNVGSVSVSQPATANAAPLALNNNIVLNGANNGVALNGNSGGNLSFGNAKVRSVAPQQQVDYQQRVSSGSQGGQGSQVGQILVPAQIAFNDAEANRDNVSRLASAETEFRQLVGDATEGTIARFLQNRLNVMLWYRPPSAPELVFGALLDLVALREHVSSMVKLEPAWGSDFAVALLDDGAKPVTIAPAGFAANWKRPFVATEVGEALPHWEMAVYLRNPDALGNAARTATLTLFLLVSVLVVAIGTGSWLIVADVRRQLALARLKTDFVSNVSHELKTPLTSIRMFAELLAEGRVSAEKQQSFLGIITTEAARLTRLINNVLDFAKLDRGEKHFEKEPCDFASLAAETLAGYRAHLESSGFTLEYQPPSGPVPVLADRDALAQVVVNLLSNAEKYSNGSRAITVTLAARNGAQNLAELSVLDRGPGVPRGCEEKIFEQFFRAHDSLASGIQGSGLGLTLARQIARAHGGDVTYAPREGGGSCFTLHLPLVENSSGQKA